MALGIDGQPAAGLRVRHALAEEPDHGAYFFDAKTDQDGTFTIQRPELCAIISASAPDRGSAAQAPVSRELKEITLRMQLLVRVRGRLINHSGQPVEEGYIRYGVNADTPSRDYADSAPLSMDGDGYYHLERITPGVEYNVIYLENFAAQPILVTRFTAQLGKDLELGETPLPKPAGTHR